MRALERCLVCYNKRVKNIVFIVNPKSGKKRLDIPRFEQSIKRYFPEGRLLLTQGPSHATQLARAAAQQSAQAVIAVGGDGTINEVAQGLVGTKTALGVIARGSGNGFARELGMLLPPEKAVERLTKLHPVLCDVGRANGELFLNLAGVGIEAVIAWQFMEQGKTGKRGMWPYFKMGVQTAFSYKPQCLCVTYDGKMTEQAPLTLVFANGRQYGSNFKIAPDASLTDGFLDMVTVKNGNKLKLLLAAPFFFTNKWRPFGLTDVSPVKHALIAKKGDIIYHIDGEPRKTQDKLEICIEPKSLYVLMEQENG